MCINLKRKYLYRNRVCQYFLFHLPSSFSRDLWIEKQKVLVKYNRESYTQSPSCFFSSRTSAKTVQSSKNCINKDESWLLEYFMIMGMRLDFSCMWSAQRERTLCLAGWRSRHSRHSLNTDIMVIRSLAGWNNFQVSKSCNILTLFIYISIEYVFKH